MSTHPDEAADATPPVSQPSEVTVTVEQIIAGIRTDNRGRIHSSALIAALHNNAALTRALRASGAKEET